MRKSVFFLLLVFPAAAVDGFEKNARGARPLALAGAFVAVADDPWTPWHNPAGLASITSFKSSLFVLPEPFGLKELRTSSAAALFPTSLVNIGVVIDDFGSSLYRESTALVGIGSTIEEGVALGIAANIGVVSIERYGTASIVTVDLGAKLELLKNLDLGYTWKNIGGATIGKSLESTTQIQTLGLCYIPHPLAQITFDLEKDIRFPFTARAGIELHILDQIVFRFGCSNSPDTFAAGFGAMLSGWEFSYALNTHPQLGMTHAIGISFVVPR